MSIQHKDIAAIREDYCLGNLSELDLLNDPIQQFKKWFDEAVKASVKEPNAMTLSTVNAQLQPSSRIVLLKDLKANGFSFFTNYLSRKGKDMMTNPQVSLLFFWQELQRQVRIEGQVVQLPEEDSDDYFLSRPISSQVGAIASPQSEIIANREILEQRVAVVNQQLHAGVNIVRPSYWGGYLVIPHKIEFWQGRSSRLHDRLEYVLNADNTWQIHRLAP